MAYDWDLFISYPRRDPVGPWVQQYFYPLLQRWLRATVRIEPRVFLDMKMEDGTNWPSNLQECLHRSKYMVAVLAPPYFGSRWCLAEWQTMLDRATHLGIGLGQRPGLIQPIRFIDGDSFPQEARELQDGDADYRPFNSFPPGRATLRSRSYLEFQRKVQALSERLASRLDDAPPWQADWPQLQRPPNPPESPAIPFKKVGLG